ncbi:hypothetical protein ES703_76110 [subsurface metagenome]
MAVIVITSKLRIQKFKPLYLDNLHYVLDLWFEKVVKPCCEGEAYLCRYADDFVAAFSLQRDAERFYEALVKRLNKFGLEVAEDKTKIIRFTRFRKEEGVSAPTGSIF